MGVNGMLTAGGVPLANGGARGTFKIIQIPAPLVHIYYGKGQLSYESSDLLEYIMVTCPHIG